jgi:hypothetical protein
MGKYEEERIAYYEDVFFHLHELREFMLNLVREINKLEDRSKGFKTIDVAPFLQDLKNHIWEMIHLADNKIQMVRDRIWEFKEKKEGD